MVGTTRTSELNGSYNTVAAAMLIRSLTGLCIASLAMHARAAAQYRDSIYTHTLDRRLYRRRNSCRWQTL